MTREFIMRVTIDDDGHEYDLTRKEELVRCGECESRVWWQSEEGYVCDCDGFLVEDDYFCAMGKRKP